MTAPRASSRGVALLLSLLALSVASSVSLSMLRTGTTASLTARAAAQELECRLILDALMPRLLALLDGNEGAPPLQLSPGINDLAHWKVDELSVLFEAIDLSGRLHLDHLDSFAADGLPASLRTMHSKDFPRSPPNGQRSRNQQTPLPLLESIATLASERSREAVFAFPPRQRNSASNKACVALQLTTYGDGRLNVRTAPLQLLEAALRGRDPAAARAILNLREGDEPIPDELVARLSPLRSVHEQPDRYAPLGGESSAAGLVISFEHGGSLRRWWMVAEHDNRSSTNRWVLRESRRID